MKQEKYLEKLDQTKAILASQYSSDYANSLTESQLKTAMVLLGLHQEYWDPRPPHNDPNPYK